MGTGLCVVKILAGTPPHALTLSAGIVASRPENSPVIHRRVKNAAPVKVVQSQGDDEEAMAGVNHEVGPSRD